MVRPVHRIIRRRDRIAVAMTVEITTPRFRGRVVIRHGHVADADLLFSWAIGWTPAQLRDYIIRKGWSVRAWC